MDSVRFGRALGVGARAGGEDAGDGGGCGDGAEPFGGCEGTEAAREDGCRGDDGQGGGSWGAAGKEARRTTAQVRQTERGLKEGSRRFGEAVGGRLVKLSGVLWLELTGVFFGIFALFAANGAWKLRGAITATGCKS